MDNQHTKIKGYRDLTQGEIDLMNEIKLKGVELEALINKVTDHVYAQFEVTSDAEGCEIPSEDPEYERLVAANPVKWIGLGTDHFQQGLMALTRAVAQPTFF